MEAVSDVLASRAPEPAGLRRMVLIAVTAHVALTIALLLMPSLTPRDAPAEDAITISLGDAPGPSVGGLTSAGGQAVQAPEPEAAKPRAPTPPAALAPEMTIPSRAPAKPAQKTPVRQAPDEARSRTPTTGPEPRPGSTIVDTGGRGTSPGLTLGGGGTGGAVNLANFCCPEYLSTMIQLINRHWDSKQQTPGQTVMRFTIERDGRISSLQVQQSSGYFALDQTAQRALVLTRQFPPLPSQYTEEQLTVELVFNFVR
jgi:TonB family protein